MGLNAQLFTVKPEVLVSMMPSGRSPPTPHKTVFGVFWKNPDKVSIFGSRPCCYHHLSLGTEGCRWWPRAWNIVIPQLRTWNCAPDPLQVPPAASAANMGTFRRRRDGRDNFGRLLLHLSALPRTWPMAHSQEPDGSFECIDPLWVDVVTL